MQIAALAIKSGNGLLLKGMCLIHLTQQCAVILILCTNEGGKEAEHSNKILYRIIDDTIRGIMREEHGGDDVTDTSSMMELISSREDIHALLQLGKFTVIIISVDLCSYICLILLYYYM